MFLSDVIPSLHYGRKYMDHTEEYLIAGLVRSI
ncbi:hypothetical protein ACOMICROBIO_FLGHMIGD_03920 [Vibrio sp. B1FLJ16]|nr:hypothetical protein ACOMICROBIO_FLGHMIGD_03920 [Vibrio sp. B1FLJ16]CAE6938808.1 hypothetical protein ACOMICROBIO_FLGHMIGD_03920 [Vibrio sp. B1FLJ16]